MENSVYGEKADIILLLGEDTSGLSRAIVVARLNLRDYFSATTKRVQPLLVMKEAAAQRRRPAC